jgi:hypothetical protein
MTTAMNTRVISVLINFNGTFGTISGRVVNNAQLLLATSQSYINGSIISANVNSQRCSTNCYILVNVDTPAVGYDYNNYSIQAESWPCIEDGYQTSVLNLPLVSCLDFFFVFSVLGYLCQFGIHLFSLIMWIRSRLL